MGKVDSILNYIDKFSEEIESKKEKNGNPRNQTQ